MNQLNELRIFLDRFFKKRKTQQRKMKRIFQWRRYLEWRELAPEERLLAKRFLLIPLFAYLIIEIINQNFYLIVLFLIGYLLYKKFKKDGIARK